MTVKKPTAKQAAANWKSVGSPDDLGEAEQLAHAIINYRRDLLPSVERIMTAQLDAGSRVRALNLFQDALHTPGDVNRDPRIAIARCGLDQDAASVGGRAGATGS